MIARFSLLDELGRGGMGVVWRARDEETGETVAVKILRAQYAGDRAYREKFARRVEFARRVDSPRVVQVLAYRVRDGLPYLAMEYVPGPTLRERLRADDPLAWPAARALLGQFAAEPAAVHASRVVHRDLKPSNIVLDRDGHPRLTGFRVARATDLTAPAHTSTVIGTPAYLPPQGARDERSDLHARGVVAYEPLAGVPLFEGETPQELLLDHMRDEPDPTRLPPEACPLVGSLLAKHDNRESGRPGGAGHVVTPIVVGRS